MMPHWPMPPSTRLNNSLSCVAEQVDQPSIAGDDIQLQHVVDLRTIALAGVTDSADAQRAADSEHHAGCRIDAGSHVATERGTRNIGPEGTGLHVDARRRRRLNGAEAT